MKLAPLDDTDWIPPTHILPHLYLGSIHALHEGGLTTLGITHILSLCNTPHFGTTKKTHKYLLLADSTSQDFLSLMEEICTFVDAAQETGGACLVHCSAGASRSPAVVLAYLVLRKNFTLKDAYEHVKALRKQTAPNAGFWAQLLELERQVLKSNSMRTEEVSIKKGD
jgi:atypical dual specificity phosphatase